MLDACFVVSEGGFVLFSFQLAALVGDPLGELVKRTLLEEKAGCSVDYTVEGAASYRIHWKRANAQRLVFVSVRRRDASRAAARAALARAHVASFSSHTPPCAAPGVPARAGADVCGQAARRDVC